MSAAVSKFFGKGGKLISLFCALPMFLVLMLIPAEIALAFVLLACWFNNIGWRLCGWISKSFAIAMGVLIFIAIIRFLFGWFVEIVREIRNRDEKENRASISSR